MSWHCFLLIYLAGDLALVLLLMRWTRRVPIIEDNPQPEHDDVH